MTYVARLARGRPVPPPCLAGLLMVSLFAQRTMGDGADVPLYHQDPFDRVVLTPEQGGIALDIIPLDQEGTRVPPDPKPADRLLLRLLSDPDHQYEVEFQYIDRIERFPEIVLHEAQVHVQQGHGDQAIPYFDLLFRKWPQTEGLEPAFREFLLKDAAAAYRAGRFHHSLADLDELKRRAPNHGGLSTALGAVLGRIVDRAESEQDFRRMREWISLAETRYPSAEMSSLVSSWRDRLQKAADGQLALAKELAGKESWSEARQACRQALLAWPDSAAAESLARQIDERYRSIVVAVTRISPQEPAAVPLEWASRRARRLTSRLLVEQVGFGSDGGQYESPWGQLSASESGDQVTWQLAPAPGNAPGATAFDMARYLHGDSPALQRQIDLKRWVREIRVKGPHEFSVSLTSALLRPERIFQVDVAANPESVKAPGNFNRPFNPSAATDSATKGTRFFVANPRYQFASADSLQEIEERPIASFADQLRALRVGEVDLLEHVLPADATSLTSDDSAVASPYAAPSLVVLIPNLNRTLPANRMARRALLLAIDRDRLLRDEILAGAEPVGCQVLSGPFPMGFSLDDPLAYASDASIRPQRFDPLLARTLYQMALRQIPTEKEAPPDRRPPLILAHPADPFARGIADFVERSWRVLGVTTERRELDSATAWPSDDNWDLAFLEMVMSEPLQDIHSLLGDLGLVPDVSPYLILALRRAQLATNWDQARQSLHEVHRLCQEETALLPLCQIQIYLARRRELAGIPARPLRTYDGVEAWRATDSPAPTRSAE